MIRLDKVSKYYKSNTLVAVGMRKISLSLGIGEFVAITGESGSGKSTLLNILSGLDTFEEGEFFLFDEPTSHYTIAQWEAYRAAYVGFVFQNYNIIDSYTVYQNVLMSLEFQGYDEKLRHQRALDIIDRVGLSHRVHHKASKLSGGEKQRTVIARALAKDCPAILCDEPTGNLDSATGEEIIKLLHDISKDKLVVIVTHHFPEVEPYATRRIKMSDGEIIEDIKLKSNDHTPDIKAVEEKHIDLKTTSRIALRNLFALPRKFIFVLLLQAVFVFLAFLIYGTTNSLFHQNSLLPDAIEASEHQLYVQRFDGQPISDLEVEAFAQNSYVRAINLYESSTSLFTSIGRTRIFIERTGVLNESDILLGAFPIDMTEVMISEDLSIYLNVTVGDEVTIRTIAFEPYPFTISGISNRVSKSVYFHDDYFTDETYVFKSIINRIGITMTDAVDTWEFERSYRNIIVDTELLDDEIMVYVNYEYPGLRDVELSMETGYGIRDTYDVQAQIQYSESVYEMHMSETVYESFKDAMLDAEGRHKIVLNVYDRYDGTRLLDQIDQDTYIVYYEALTQNQDFSSFGYVLRVGAYLLIVVVGLLLLMLLRVVFKNMVQTRRKDFAIYRSIGASKRFLGRLIFMEQGYQILIGTLLTLSVALSLMFLIAPIRNSLRYVNTWDILVVFAVFAYMTIITPIKYNQSIFEISVIETLTKSQEV